MLHVAGNNNIGLAFQGAFQQDMARLAELTRKFGQDMRKGDGSGEKLGKTVQIVGRRLLQGRSYNPGELLFENGAKKRSALGDYLFDMDQTVAGDPKYHDLIIARTGASKTKPGADLLFANTLTGEVSYLASLKPLRKPEDTSLLKPVAGDAARRAQTLVRAAIRAITRLA